MTELPESDRRRVRWILALAALIALIIILAWPRAAMQPVAIAVTVETTRENYLVTEWVDARAVVRPSLPNATYEWFVDQGELEPARDLARARGTRGRPLIEISVVVTAPDGRKGTAKKALRLVQNWDELPPDPDLAPKPPPLQAPIDLQVDFDKPEICRGEALRARARAKTADGSSAQIYYTFARDVADDSYRTPATITAGLDTGGPTKVGTYRLAAYATHDREALEDLTHGGWERALKNKNITMKYVTFKVLECEAPEPMWGIDFAASQSAGHEYWFKAWDLSAMKTLEPEKMVGASIEHMQKTELMKRVVKYEWDFGDGQFATTTTPRVLHTFNPTEPVPEQVTYKIKLKVTRDDGKVGEAAHYVAISYWLSEIPRPAISAYASLPKLIDNEWHVRLAVFSEGAVAGKLDLVHRHDGEWEPGDKTDGQQVIDPSILYDRLDLPPGAVTRGELTLPRDAFANDRMYTYVLEARDPKGRLYYGSFMVAEPTKFAPKLVGTWRDPDALPNNKPVWLLEDAPPP